MYMSTNNDFNNPGDNSIFLNEFFMAFETIFVTILSLISILIIRNSREYFALFDILIKLFTTVSMYFAFRHYNWDVAKGLMGGVLFSFMYREAYLVLGSLWGEADFDTYLVVGVQGSIYLATAGMSFLLTVIITINHFLINYAKHGNPDNVIFNRMAIGFKLAVYALLLITNGMLGFEKSFLWKNALEYLTDMAILLLIVSIESQFDSFKVLRRELLMEKKQRREKHED